ncbi:MAG: hypothetical protein AB7O97_02685 [Planctomycetota bacterium]
MKLIVNLLIAVALFAGSLLGGLAVTGRLNHDGVANIPVLNGLFPPPPATEGDPNDPHATDAAGNGEHGAATDAGADGHGATAEASHADPHAQGLQGQGLQGQDPQGQEPAPTRPLKRGRSIFEQEAPAGGGHGGGHGEEPAGHGEAGADHGGGGDHGAEPHATTAHPPAAPHDGGHAAERDFDALADELAQDRRSRYAPGGYFRFDGMPSGITPQQLNDAWKRVQEVMSDLDKRGQSLDLREKALKEFADDIARRQTELGKERVELENLQRRLDERIDQFQEQVKMVRTDEVAGLKRNAQTLASFEPSKVAELITEQWKTEAGQDEVLKTFEFMDKDAVNQILQALPNAMVREVLQKRLKVSKEPVPSAAAPR